MKVKVNVNVDWLEGEKVERLEGGKVARWEGGFPAETLKRARTVFVPGGRAGWEHEKDENSIDGHGAGGKRGVGGG